MSAIGIFRQYRTLLRISPVRNEGRPKAQSASQSRLRHSRRSQRAVPPVKIGGLLSGIPPGSTALFSRRSLRVGGGEEVESGRARMPHTHNQPAELRSTWTGEGASAHTFSSHLSSPSNCPGMKKPSAWRHWVSAEHQLFLLTRWSCVAGESVVVRKPAIHRSGRRAIEPGEEHQFLQVVAKSVRHGHVRDVGPA